MKLTTKLALTACAVALFTAPLSTISAPSAHAGNYNACGGQVSLASWSSKNISCPSQRTRHVNHVANDGYRYHGWVGRGGTSSAPYCYAAADGTYFQVEGDGGLTGYRI